MAFQTEDNGEKSYDHEVRLPLCLIKIFTMKG